MGALSSHLVIFLQVECLQWVLCRLRTRLIICSWVPILQILVMNLTSDLVSHSMSEYPMKSINHAY